jgi:hypothetical protein
MVTDAADEVSASAWGEEERAATGVPHDVCRHGGGGLMAKRKKATGVVRTGPAEYGGLVTGIADLLEQARRGAARAVNSILTATYWEVGRRIVEFEQGGKGKAEYGQALLLRLGSDLSGRLVAGSRGATSFACGTSISDGRYCRQRRQYSRLGHD